MEKVVVALAAVALGLSVVGLTMSVRNVVKK